ncbi:protein tiptop [Caerostris extrusa]|uniref:Protein tiptop n=1 Tax=Caerostris extrusa TaxID=172846 RepID=A0AAV4S2P0_CAEEX|nr:protein tiptop [Caerostris extrusa]
MDISRTAISNPELIQGTEDDEDEAEEDMSSSVATEEDAPLDFSVKRATEDESTDDDRSMTPNGLNPPSISQDGPLDLSVPRRRSTRSGDGPRQAKIAKLETALHLPSSPWGYSAPKHLPKTMVKATVAEVPMWNGKVKSEKRDKGHSSGTASKHSSLNRSNVYNPLLHKNASPPLNSLKMSESRKSSAGSSKTDPYRPAGRQNPWQSQWMSRSSEQTRDVFTCVWCKESFRSLEDMTVHMKQSPRCGMAGMQTTLPATSPNSSSVINHQHNHHQSPLPAKCSTSSSSAAGPAANAVIKENVTLPRKLSFKTLADMTTHMRVTQHYTNIISQEQIISWRTPEDKMAAQSQVNAVLTCKVCDQAFGSLKELSYHMVKNSHYKEHILRSITEGGGRRRQTRERRKKKSLPVRKLLELERMELNKQSPASSNDVINPVKNEVVDGKISCEECTEKVDAKDFVQHIKNCAQGSRSQQSVKSSASDGAKSSSVDTNPDVATSSEAGAAPRSSPSASQESPADEANKSTTGPILQEDSMCDSVESTGSTSVLNAIEKLIEKSFETKGRRNAVSTGILQRLGIDEEVYPPWHPSSSPSAFGVLRSTVDMQRKSTSPIGRLHDFKMEMADFSGSESRSRSSSTSEKHHTFDEHLRLTFGISAKDVMNRVSTPSSASQSCSPVHFQPESPADDRNAVFMSKEATNLASTSQAAIALCNSSPKTRSVTPSSDRDHSEKLSAKDGEQQKVTSNKEPEDLTSDDREEKAAASDDEHVVDCSREPTPKSEDRQTPLSRSSSCEPEMALSTSPAVVAASCLESPDKLSSKSIPRKRRQNSETSRKSPSSSKRRSHSHRKKGSDIGNVDCDSAMGSPTSTHSSEVTSPRQKHSDSAASDHPLKELQKLLDKTDAHLSRPNLPATPGSILAFSWACNEATASDSLMKCAFCETHFISKGAYRHHLSKMHFVKDGSLAEIAAASTWKPPSTSGNSKTSPSPGGSSNGCGNVSAGPSRTGNSGGEPASPQKELAPPAPIDESPHSKFLKYTELAKQLSSNDTRATGAAVAVCCVHPVDRW